MRKLLGLLTGLFLLALSLCGLALSLALSQPALASGDVGLWPVAAVHASPTSDPGYPALNLTDAAPGSIWRSSPGADAAWAVLDFGEPFRVDYARLYVPGDFHGELTLEYQDEGVWRPLAGGAHLAPPASAGWREVDLSFDSAVATQLRLFLRGTGREPFLGGLGQVEFYGDRPALSPSRLIPVEITSSSANPGLPAAHLADGNTYTRWETPADQPPSAWVTFRFAAPAQIATLKVYGAGEAADALTWEYWADGTWLPFPGLVQLPLAGLTRTWHRYGVSQPFVTTDRVRLVVENRGGLSKLGGFGEVEVWGTPLATPPASLFTRRTFWAPAESRELGATVPTTAPLLALPLDLSGFSAARLVFDARDVDDPGEIGVSVNGAPVPALTGSSPDAWGSYALPLSLADLKPGVNEVTLRLTPGSDGVIVDNVRIELLARDGVALPVADGPEADRRALTSWQVTAGPNGGARLEIALPGTYQLEELALFAADRLNQGIDVEYREGDAWIALPELTGLSGLSLARNWNRFLLASQPVADRLRLRFTGTPGAVLGGVGELFVKGSPLNLGPPQVRIASPQSGELVKNPVLVTGTLDNVEAGISVNGVKATVAGGGFSATIWLDPSGPKDARLVTAIATDAAGRTGREEVKVYLNKRPPGFVSLSPADGTITASRSLVVSGELDDNAAEVKVNGEPVNLRGRRFSTTVDLAEGPNRIAVTATDYFAGTSASSTVAFTVVCDTTPPRLALDTPADGEALRTPSVAVTGRVEDLTPVTVAVNGYPASVSNGVFQVSGLTLVEGENHFNVTAADAAGHSATLRAKVILDTTRPSLTVSTPAPGQVFNYQPIKVSGTVADATPTAVVVNGITAQRSGETFEVWVPLVEGPNTLLAKAIDAAGNELSDIRQVTLDTIPPSIPTGLEVIPGPDNLTVQWRPNAEPDLTYYVLRRTPAFSDGTAERIIPKSAGPTYRDPDVVLGKEYTYALRAVDHAENTSAWSASVTGKAGLAAAPIDPGTGGEVKYENLKVEVPAQALPEGSRVTILALDSAVAPPAEGNVLVGDVLNLDVVQNPDQIANPEEVEFARPVTLTFTYREEDIPPGMSEEHLFLYVYDLGTQSWVRVPNQVINPETNTITVVVKHFSTYSIQASAARPPDPQTLSGLGVAPYQAYFQENNESLSPASGNLVIQAVDLHLPGRNGLNLEITRSYDMLGSQIAALDPKSSPPFQTFGQGWTLALPWLQKNDNGQIVSLPGGGTYEVKWTMDGPGWGGQGHGYFAYHEGEHFRLEQFQRQARDRWFLWWKIGEVWEATSYVLTLKDGRRYEFDASGKPVRLSDRTGQNTIAYAWNGSELTSITDSIGRTVSFTYANGRITSLRSGERTVSYEYDGPLSGSTDPEGRKTAYSYTAMYAGQVYDSSAGTTVGKTHAALLAEVTYPTRGFTRYSYQGKSGGFGEEIARAVVSAKVQYPVAGSSQGFNQTSFAYSWNDSKRQITAATITAPAQITELIFNDKSLATRKVTKDRTKGSILVEQVDYEYNLSLKAVTRESYTKAGLDPATSQYHFGPAYYKTYAYDDWGNLTYAFHSGTGLESRYAYANTNSAQSFPAPFAPAPFTSSVPAKVYDLVTGQARLNHDPVRGVTVPVQSHYQYDGVGNLVKEAKRHDGAWLVTSYEYDQYGNATRKTDPLGRVTRYEYDGIYKNAYPTRVTVEGLKDADDLPLANVVTEYGYHFDTGLKAWEKDGRGYVTSYEYDKLNRLRKTVYPGAGSPTKLTDFDDVNNTYTVTDENQNRTTFFYDGLAHLVQVVQYKRNGGAYSPYATTAFTYDASGNVATMTDANGNVTSYTYDGLGRLVKTTLPDETPANAGDNPVSQVLFDDYANTVTTVDANGHKTVQIKDWADRVTQIAQHNTYTGEVLTTSVAYDRLTNKVRVVDPRGDTTRQVFDDLGRVVEAIYPAMGMVKPGATYETTDSPRVTYTYDAVGNKLTETSANGHASGQAVKYTTTYKYDALNRLIKTVEPFTAQDGAVKQRVTRTYYDAAGNKVKVVDGNGHAVTFEYDARKRLTNQTDARGYATTHEYDPAGNRIRTTDPRGYSTWYVFDELNRLVRGILPDETPPANPHSSPEDNPCVEFTYDLVGNKLTERDPNGNISTFIYTPRYWLKSVTDPAGAVTSFGYDKVGNQTSLTDPNGNTTTNVYDDLNRLIKTINPFGQASTFAYDRAGNRTKQVDTNGHVTEWTYNPLKKLTQVKDAKGGVTRYQYDANGNLVAMIDAKGQSTRYTYNELNWLTRETNSLGLVTSYDYDLAGNRSQAKSPRGVQTSYQYYPNNLLKEVTYTLGQEQERISYEYDPAGNRTRMVDPSGEAAYAYDPLNQITSLDKSILGRPYTTQYRYDKAGNVTGIRYPSAAAWLEYQYSNTNRVYAIPGLADGTLSNPAFAYDPAGNLRSVRLNSGVTTALTPDKLNRLASLSVTSPRLSAPVLSLNYTHDGEGNILTRNDNVYRYDELDRLIYSQIRGVFSDDIPARKGYVTGDFLGEKAPNYGISEDTPVSFDYAASSVGLDFGGTAQVRRVHLTKDNPAADIARVKPSTLDLYASTDSTTFTRLDPAAYQLQTTLDGMTFEFPTPLSTGQLKVHSKFDDRDEDGTFADKATFRNVLGEILRAEQEVSQATLEYGYDAVGNRTYERFTKVSVHGKDYTYYANSNRLLTDGKYAFVYDDDGNLIRKSNKFTISGEIVFFTTEGRGVEYWEYGYNLRNQLTQVKKNGQLVATYAYDGLGLRVSATTTLTSRTTGQSKTTTRDYVFDLADRVIYDRVISTSGELSSTEDPETPTENSYVFAGGVHFAKVEGPIGITAEVYYYHNDNLGSPMAITDGQGTVAWSQDYLPYGEALNESAAQTRTRFTFTGKELDPATGLMYYSARWYDPDLGRFMTEDTYAGDPNQPQKLNRYTYALGNPLKYVDPDGHDVGTPGKDASDMAKTEEGRRELEERKEYIRDPEAAFDRMWERIYGSAKETPDVAVVVTAAVVGPRFGKTLGGLIRGLFDKIITAFGAALSATDAKIDAAVRWVMEKPFKVNHIFDPKHNFNPLLRQFGSKENVVREIIKAVGKRPDGVFDIVVNVGGKDVRVTGNVIDGITKIGSCWIE